MKAEYFMQDELSLLEDHGQGFHVSVIVSFQDLPSERKNDSLRIKHAINEAERLLRERAGKAEVDIFRREVTELCAEMDVLPGVKGMGLFVSKKIKKRVPFYFSVTEKISVSDSFDLREWLFQQYYLVPFIVLLLSRAESQLFEAKFSRLKEVANQYFPLKWKEEYEYNRPARGSSYVGNAFVKEFERDKSQVREIRYHGFLHQVDDALCAAANQQDLIIVGTDEDVAYFNKITKYKSIVGQVLGSYTHLSKQELGEQCFKEYKSYLDHSKTKLVKEFEEKRGQGRGVFGLAEVWNAAKEQRGMLLLVEKDFSVHGFLEERDDGNLFLNPPKKKYHILTDAVHILMETILKQKASIVLMDNDSLIKYQRIALITRY